MDLTTQLARKARELTDGMMRRVNRQPDVADYRAAFVPILESFFAKDATDHRISASHEQCEHAGCSERAMFIKYGKALCYEHRNEHKDATPADRE